MNKEQYFAFHKDFCETMRTITHKKNKDYTGDNDDPFANFQLVDKLNICSVERGLLVRMADKFARLVNLADGRKPAVTDESITDTLHDLANYCVLFAGCLASGKKPSTTLYELFAKGRKCITKIGVFQTKEQAQAALAHQQANWPTFELYIQELGEEPDDDEHPKTA